MKNSVWRESKAPEKRNRDNRVLKRKILERGEKLCLVTKQCCHAEYKRSRDSKTHREKETER